jgi:hypothetical protein
MHFAAAQELIRWPSVCTEAAQSYEVAIKAFRADKGKYDHKFEMTVAKEYAKLLRQQKHSAKAKVD